MDLEELKKSFIVDEESFEEERLVKLVQKINQICLVDRKGHVNFRKEGFGDKEKIKFILVARFLANKLDETISKEVTNEEIEKMLGKSPEQIRARLSDLRKGRNFIKDLNKNTHEIKPFFVSKILEGKNG